MKTTITRRNVIAGAAALPLLPVSAFAVPADPAVEAYRVWRAAYGAHEFFLNTHQDWDTPEVQASFDRQWAARHALSDAVATTPAGLACQVRFAFDAFGELTSAGQSVDNPYDFQFDNWADDLERRLLLAMLAGAEGIANA